jgi:polysaccharide chain length determinant protein (PEP-CTERM system associated)
MYFLIPLFLGWIVVWGASWILPVRYKSGTLILVEQPTMPKDYVLPNVSDNLQDRLQSITQQILSRTRLLLIIDQLNLYGGSKSRKKITPDEKVDQMRKDIDIELVRDEAHEGRITAFNIYYWSRDPHIAQRVTGELSKLFISANLEVRQQQSEDTTKFLESQLENARTSLAEQEAKIRQFKGEHIGDLPSQQTSNLQILSGLQSQLGNEGDALNAAQQQRVYLQTLINQYRTLQGTTRSADGTPTRLPVIEQQLDKLRAQLADLSSHYTDSYPDIRHLKIEIAKTEKMKDDLIAELKNKNSGDNQADGTVTARDAVDLSQNSPILQLQGQLQANQSEIRNREQAVASLKAKISDYQARLNQEPVTEQQMADLTRGYDQSKANYDDLLKKKNQSEMATSMELLQQGERFSILDPPSLPPKPDFPNRVKFCGMGIGIGLALGVLVAGVFEFIDDRMHSEKEIKNLLPIAVISEIPEIASQADKRRTKRKVLLGWGMAAIVVVVILAGSAFNYIHS